MLEELALLREVSKAAAQAQLAQAEFWRNMSVSHGFVPDPVPEALTDMPRLLHPYHPNLGSDTNRHAHRCFTKINEINKIFVIMGFNYSGYFGISSYLFYRVIGKAGKEWQQ
jgi:hypothetical protein